jgi:hypothetical protein
MSNSRAIPKHGKEEQKRALFQLDIEQAGWGGTIRAGTRTILCGIFATDESNNLTSQNEYQ